MFEIIKNPDPYKIGIFNEIWNLDNLGKRAVQEYDPIISKQAQKHNIDPDLIRSVMYAENARGHKGGANWLADKLKTSDSIMPMNIKKDMWAGLIDKEPQDMYDADANIEAATVLLKRIRDRVDNPTPEKIGSIWNFSGREKTNEFGEYIGQLYREKPWKKME